MTENIWQVTAPEREDGEFLFDCCARLLRRRRLSPKALATPMIPSP